MDLFIFWLGATYSLLTSHNHFNQRYKDLAAIKVALDMYYIDNKAYPRSVGFDGLITKHGESRKDWIRGLTPKYISKLPSEPRNTSDTRQYLYKSNGKDYKLIAYRPEDCNSVRVKNLNLIDPNRDCWAYGFWTKGAKNW